MKKEYEDGVTSILVPIRALEVSVANTEMQLVLKIIRTGEMRKVIEWGITEDDFLLLEPKSYFKQLFAVYTSSDTFGSVMGPHLAAERFSHLNLLEVDEHTTIEHLCQEVRKRRLTKEIKEGSLAVQTEADYDPFKAMEHMQTIIGKLMRLDGGRNVDVDAGTGVVKVVQRYEFVKGGGATGVFPWPWWALQEETGGIQCDDYVVLFGRPKQMKTWVLAILIAWIASAPWKMNNDFNDIRVVVYTKEMTPENTYQRIVACLAELAYRDFRLGTLDPYAEERLYYWRDLIEREWVKTGRLIVLSGKDVAGRDTVAWLQSKVKKYGATIVFIDGLYLMSTSSGKHNQKDNERVASISRDVRQMVLAEKIPCIATMQANRQAVKNQRAELDEIAYSDALAQDATIAARVMNWKYEHTIAIALGGSREFQLEGFQINAIPATNFSFKGILTGEELEKMKQADAEHADEVKKKKKGKAPTLSPESEDLEQRNKELYQKALQGLAL